MNKEFESQFARFSRAFTRGTPEYKLRTSYPGCISPCDDPECVNSARLEITSYWLCEDCGKIAPDTGYYCIHAPSKAKLTDAKRKRNNIAAFSAHCVLNRALLTRARMSCVPPADGEPGVQQDPEEVARPAQVP